MDGEEVSQDPFSKENIDIVQFITLARIYDVLLALLQEADADVAGRLLEIHSMGGLMGPSPKFSGAFITDIANEEESDGESTPAD